MIDSSGAVERGLDGKREQLREPHVVSFRCLIYQAFNEVHSKFNRVLI